MRTLQQLSAALEAARREQRRSYDDLARAAGLTPLATRRAMQGTAAPRVTTLMALADELGLELLLLPRVVAQSITASEPEAQRPVTLVERLAAS